MSAVFKECQANLFITVNGATNNVLTRLWNTHNPVESSAPPNGAQKF